MEKIAETRAVLIADEDFFVLEMLDAVDAKEFLQEIPPLIRLNRWVVDTGAVSGSGNEEETL